jgi:hypothetical protein
MSQILVPYVICSDSSAAGAVKVLLCVGKHPAVHPDSHGGHAQGLQATQVSSHYCRVGVAWLIGVWCGSLGCGSLGCGLAHWDVAWLTRMCPGSSGCGVAHWSVTWGMGGQLVDS